MHFYGFEGAFWGLLGCRSRVSLVGLLGAEVKWWGYLFWGAPGTPSPTPQTFPVLQFRGLGL